jgi:uncharacterized protein (DUF1778 family)
MASTENWQSPQARALQDAIDRKITTQEAADLLASLSLANGSVEDEVYELWVLLVEKAQQSSASHATLVDILVHLSKLDDAKTEAGESIELHDMQLWRDLPMFGWQIRDSWNIGIEPKDSAEVREKKISEFTNLNAFAAQLMATEEQVFDLSWFALVTFREALENPQADKNHLELFVPAAASWLDHAGVELYNRDDQFESTTANGGAPGKGGELWTGAPGFHKDRWALWQERFAKLAGADSGLGEKSRTAAQDAHALMKDVSTGEIE